MEEKQQIKERLTEEERKKHNLMLDKYNKDYLV
jgi:hypothetical protein